MSEAHPRSSMLVICVFFVIASAMMSAATTTTEGDKCKWNRPNGTGEHKDQSCFLLISEGMTFYQANQSCVDEGAHLVSIDNQDENDLVYRLTKNTQSWIGLYRMTNEICAGSSCSWMWLDGSSLEYDMWPNGIARGIIQCVFMNTAGKWDYGRECSTNLSSVCKKSIPSTITPEPTTTAITGEMTDTSVSDSDTGYFSIFMGIGIFVGFLVIAIIVGAVACLMKRRQGRKMKTSKDTANRDASTNTGDYENVGMSVSCHGLVISQPATPEGVYVNSITTDSTVSTRNHEDATSKHPAYEEFTNYTAVSPEYTPLQFTDPTNSNINS